MGVQGYCMNDADIENRFLRGISHGLKEIPTDKTNKAPKWGFVGFLSGLFWCGAGVNLFDLLSGLFLRG